MPEKVRKALAIFASVLLAVAVITAVTWISTKRSSEGRLKGFSGMAIESIRNR
ncbi:MAG: hypothetical protein KDA87_16300 [Planctomycetales bacterium]|nr:hypothetical protein [Planctomycetales bacterium]